MIKYVDYIMFFWSEIHLHSHLAEAEGHHPSFYLEMVVETSWSLQCWNDLIRVKI